MEKESLRKADLFSGGSIILLGLFIILHALQMPMTDSYGGVQNVWYVSPALFPLMIGAMLVLLGTLLVKTAFKAVGAAGLRSLYSYLTGIECFNFLKQADVIRFYGAVINLILFVFILVPRIDFFLAAILFLLIFFFMFYCGQQQQLPTFLLIIISGTALFSMVLFSPLIEQLNQIVPHAADWLTVLLILALILYMKTRLSSSKERKKYTTSLIIALVAPFTIGIIFKYFLLVPMPSEGLIVSLLDAIWYADIWS